MTRGMFLKNASSVFVAGLLLPVLVYGQSTHKEQCNQLLKRQTEASAGHQSDVLVSNGRELIANCSDIFPTTEQVGFLSTVGQGLIGLNQSQDAIPVLQKCVSMEPDFAPCWLELGIANENLGKIPEARDCYRKAIRIGGSSQQNAAAVGAAKVRLSNFESKQSLETSSRHSEWVDLKHDNRVVHAFIVYPEVKERVPAIIVIHAIYGLTDWDFYAEQSVSYLISHYGKDFRALVDVGRQDDYPVFPALGNILDQTVRVVHLVRQDCRHEGQVVVRLQIGRLVGHEGVSGAVRFIEAVLAEPQDDIIDPRGGLRPLRHSPRTPA